jgi:hypothetical protein
VGQNPVGIPATARQFADVVRTAYDSPFADLPVGRTFDRVKDVAQQRDERTNDGSDIEVKTGVV